MHAALLLAMAMMSGWTWAKLFVGGAWLAMALFEQKRGPSVGTHWTAPAIGGAWLVLSALVMCSMTAAGHGARLAGALMVGVGMLLRVRAIKALGAGYSDGVHPVRPPVRHGVYAHFDHPGELGALLMAVGASLAVGSVMALAWTFASLLPLTLYRFRLEEVFLRA